MYGKGTGTCNPYRIRSDGDPIGRLAQLMVATGTSSAIDLGAASMPDHSQHRVSAGITDFKMQRLTAGV